MSRIKNQPYKVTVIESERGWGQKVIDTQFFTEKSEADKYADAINKPNVSDTVPDYYVMAKVDPC